MFSRRKQKSERVPWYRESGYTGNFSEEEKQQLDAFRERSEHPAARYENLPDEVQQYIARLEVEAYDLKQRQAVVKPVLLGLIGVAPLYFHYFDGPLVPLGLKWALALILLIVAWLAYRSEWKKNADRFAAGANGAILMEWEVGYVTDSRAKRLTPTGDS